MTSLQIPDILDSSYDVPTEDTFEYAIYDIQNTLLSSLILETVKQDYHYLLQKQISTAEQYDILQRYFDLK